MSTEPQPADQYSPLVEQIKNLSDGFLHVTDVVMVPQPDAAPDVVITFDHDGGWSQTVASVLRLDVYSLVIAGAYPVGNIVVRSQNNGRSTSVRRYDGNTGRYTDINRWEPK